MWLISMPVAAAQLVLLTAAEDAALVGDEGWASRLPLAATGPGEPFVTAAGVLGAWLTCGAGWAQGAGLAGRAAACPPSHPIPPPNPCGCPVQA